MFTSDTFDDSKHAPIVKKHLIVLSSFKAKSENVN